MAPLKKLVFIAIRLFLSFFKILFGLLITYLIVAILLSLIPVNRLVKGHADLDIYLISNGVHLDIVLPLHSSIKNWASDIPPDNQVLQKAKYISFGWGDKDFYLNTPEWSDLKFKTAFRAAFLKGPSALHIDFYQVIKPSANCKKISISWQQYQHITEYIENSFKKDTGHNKIKIEGLSYSTYDVFYEAESSYSLFFTCNSWINRCLKESGIKACLWTPFAFGLLYHHS